MRRLIGLLLILISAVALGQNNEWNISTSNNENYVGVVVSNGRLGILPSEKPFQVESVILGNVYEKESPLGVSKIVKGMNFANLKMAIDGEEVNETNITNWSQTLDMKRAAFTSRFTFKNKAEITCTLYALRNLQYTAYIDITVKAMKDITVNTTGKIETPENFKNVSTSFRVLRDLETTMPILQTKGETEFGRHQVTTSASFIWHDINSTREHQRPELHHTTETAYNNQLSFEKELPEGKTLNFAWTASECTTQDFEDPQTESERFVIFSLLNPGNVLIEQHEKLWEELWQGDIIVEGDLTAQQDIRLALYHLYAFSRADANLSIAPMGLSSQNYNGHIFWDTELWMYPPLLVLHGDIAKALLAYRTERLDKAIQKAKNYGYKGAMFPWESDDTGEEATPAWALTGTFEHHITADIGIAFWNYYRVTQNKQWLKDEGYPMLQAVADYWVSRVTKNDDGSYSINNVVGANEFAPNVNDNAFTNGAAITVLKYALEAAKVLGEEPSQPWEEVASKIRILKFQDGTTREHSNYNGERIKQGDVNLLSYPLDIITDEESIVRDLNYYEPKLAEEGPAMGLSVFSILYARLGDAENAYRLFKKCYEPNKRPPFGALAEAATSNNPYFATGAGGMLQAVIFGFGGLHITEDGIVQKAPVLPKEWNSLTLKGVGPNKQVFKIEH